MSSRAALAPAVPAGAYAEREDPRPGPVERALARAGAPLARRLRRRHAGPRLAADVGAEAAAVARLSDAELAEAARAAGAELRARGFAAGPVARAFALVREAAERRVGQRHFDIQVQGGGAILAGFVAEMDTGEGKTLTATLPAATAALAGVPVHVVTVNDYLAERDARAMGPVYEALGLRVGAVVHGMSGEARRAAYACDVTYCNNKEVAFDYLRDRIVLGPRAERAQLQLERLHGLGARAHRLLLRGLHYAIVDEADSVLVDEARTPLIISGRAADDAERRVYEQARDLAARLEPRRDFTLDAAASAVGLTDAGRERLAGLAGALDGVWAGALRREDLVCQALAARHLYHADRHYLVADGKVQIVDEYTGRLMPDRSWEHGLHQAIEVKEGCPVTSRQAPLARISYQRFFRRYLRLAGMTGTAREVERELWAVYGLAVARVPTHRPVRRRSDGARVLVAAGPRWRAVVERVAAIHATGRPVLLGTRSVAASEELSAHLARAGLAHRVLNARQDREEAVVVAQAGGAGQVTVATNMAGRGTDIRLGAGVAERGGLHVIATEFHEARRIDRQLFGRAGRQGDPGSHEVIAALDDELFAAHAPRWRRRLAARLAGPDGTLPGWLARWVARRAQRAAERRHARARGDLLRRDAGLDALLAFAGRPE
jgi:preprotein translocase subunit SecA